MDNKKLNILTYAAIFSLLGVIAYVFLAYSVDIPVDIRRIISYVWGYVFFIAAFNLIGFSIMKFSNWIGIYMMQRWKMVLLYSCVALFLLLINYGLLVFAKIVVGITEPYIFPNGGQRILILLWLVDLIILGLLIANHWVVHSMNIQREASRLRDENNKARYMALQNQMNPHFLFNSLNTLIAEIEFDPANAVLFTRNLSDAYRYVLQCQDKSLVTLREELEFMQSYIFLHKVRLGDYISIDCQVTDDYLEARLPPLTLQLLAENVIKHNSITISKPVKITILVCDGMLVVNNSVNLKKSVDSTGTGLQNLSNRCLLMIGRKLIVIKEEKIFTVKVPMLYD